MMDVNVKGMFHLPSAALKPSVLKELGGIVHAASMFSERGLAKGSVYRSKHAVVGLAKNIAIEAGKKGSKAIW